ncbi:MAG: carbon-nitrogen hydrolase family protein [Deltaproteobacteria bacterium]|nr:carbon-nitrogen hydrolase family protein [Deltaproteobacteria bacterium]
MREFTVAAVQFAVTPLDPVANIGKSCQWLDRAVSEHGADLVVFPETITTGFHPGADPTVLRRLADTLPGRLSESIQAEASRHRVHVVWPTYELKDGILYNSAAVIGPSGDVLGVYRKTHPFPTERVWTTPADDPVVVRTELARIGLVICYDGDFPELCRAEALAGAEMIVRPSALLRDFEIWSLTNRARAYDNQVWFVAVNSVGPDAGANYYFGHSMIVTPLGTVAALARAGEMVVSTRVDPGLARTCMVQHLGDRNVKAYRGVCD